MKKTLLFVMAGIVLLLAVVFLASMPKQRANTQLVQQGTNNAVVNLVPSTIPVDLATQTAVMDALTPGAPERGVYVYAITDVSQKGNYYNISVAGLALGSKKMQLSNAVWFGIVQLSDQPGAAGLVLDATTTQNANYPHGGAGNILPFRSGTTAQYGISGVHNCGFQLNGWQAVDLFPTENMIYSSAEGEINYVCRDNTQVALRVGNNLYTHLVDGGQQVGDHYNQGQEIASVVVGEFSDTCGVADQGQTQYHVHFCFVPTGSNTFSADGYTLSTGSGTWTKGATTVNPLDYLTADWSNAGINPPGPAAGSNLWDSTITGVNSMVQHTANALPVHTDMSMANKVMGNIGPAVNLIYTVVLSNFDLTVTFWVIGIIAVLETVRIAYAGWMWIKKAIPIIG